MEWIFDGIGTEIIMTAIGIILGTGGGIIIYKFLISKKTIKQTQKAGKNSTQIQIGGSIIDKSSTNARSER